MIKEIKKGFESAEYRNTSQGKLTYLPEKETKSYAEKLTRNIALAFILVLVVSAIRNAKLPDGKTVMSAIQGTVDQQWDESLGKISFVSNMFPEAVSVFFSQTTQNTLVTPCIGTLIHAWTGNEPYLAYQLESNEIYALSSGQVMSIAHGINEEKVIRIRHEDGLEVLYYQLEHTKVQEGDLVDSHTIIGECLPGQQAIIEVRKEGLPIDPTTMIIPRGSSK